MANVPLRTASDLARLLDISRQRLHRYVRFANVQPVCVAGKRRLYGQDEQAAIVLEFYEGWISDTAYGHHHERHRWPLLADIMAELELLE